MYQVIKQVELKLPRGSIKLLMILLLLNCTQRASKEQLTNIENEKDTIQQDDIAELLISADTAIKMVGPDLKEKIDKQVKDNVDFDFQKCNIELLAYVWKNPDKVDESLLEKFLHTFGNECRNNAEFSGFGNKVIFKLLDSQPGNFINALGSPKVDSDYILKELERPVNDAINLNDLLFTLSSLDKADEMVEEVIMSLQKAIDKY